MDNAKKTVVIIVAAVIIAALGFLVWRSFTDGTAPWAESEKKTEIDPRKTPPQEFQELIKKGEVQVQVERAP